MDARGSLGSTRRGLAPLALVLLLLALAAPARADVSNITVNPNSPTNAAGGRTSYVITFNTSGLGGLSNSANDHITISFPAGTDPTNQLNSQVFDTTVDPNTAIGNCGTSGTTATCGLFTGKSIGGGDAVKVVINGVTNPSAGSKTLTVSTTKDTLAVTSPSYIISSAGAVTGVAVNPNSPTNAAGGRTTYAITFTASGNGAMAASANSRINITFPAGTDASNQLNSQVYDTTVSSTNAIGNCSTGATTATCGLFTNQSIPAGHNVKVVVNGVTNPGAGSPTANVSTTSDTASVASSSYTIVAANPVTSVVVNPNSPTNAADARTTYVITFKASATGGMAASANSRINITFPAETDASSQLNSQVYDTTVSSTNAIGNCSTGTTTATCGLFTNQSIPAGHDVKVVINAVTNPGAGSLTANVSTTSDPATVASSSYTIVNSNPVTNVTVDPNTPTNASGGRTSYVLTFKASATGAMAASANSRIVITLPTGTDLSTGINGAVYDVTAAPATEIGNCGFSGQVATCGLFTNQTIPAGHVVKVVGNGITNPGAGSHTLTVSTTSDPATVTSPSYTMGISQLITQPVVTPSPNNPQASPVSYTITFTVSSSGGMNQAANSRITITFPTGTSLVNATNGLVYDTTAAPGTQIGNCGFSGQTATCGLFTGQSIPASHAVRVVVNGLANPAGGNYTLQASTTSDQGRASSQYGIGGPPAAPTVSGVNPAGGPAAGGTTVTVTGTNFTGATAVRFGPNTAAFRIDSGTQITATSPAGSGIVDVTVQTPGGISSVSGADRFSYIAPPAPPAQTTQASTSPGTAAPSFSAGAPNVTGTRGAALSAIVNPHGLATTVHFEYGLDTDLTGAPLVYDQRTPDQSVGSDFTDHTVNANVANLLTNATYHVRVVATNSAGTVNGTDQVFTTKADPPPKPAVLGEQVVGAVTEGLVLIKLPGKAKGRQAGVPAKGAGFVPLTQARNLPVGTEVDSRRGTLEIETATAKVGKTQSGQFGGGLFTIAQSRDKRLKGLAQIALLDSAFKGAPSFKQCTSTGKTRAKKPPKSKVVQLLKANVKGKFRTRGHYAAATVRGTQWTMTDRCDGTLTAVRRGTVVVTDFRRKKDVVVHAGKSYLAKAP